MSYWCYRYGQCWKELHFPCLSVCSSQTPALPLERKSPAHSPLKIYMYIYIFFFFIFYFWIYITAVCNTALGVRWNSLTGFRGNSPKLCTHFCCYPHSIFFCLLPFLRGLNDNKWVLNNTMYQNVKQIHRKFSWMDLQGGRSLYQRGRWNRSQAHFLSRLLSTIAFKKRKEA